MDFFTAREEIHKMEIDKLKDHIDRLEERLHVIKQYALNLEYILEDNSIEYTPLNQNIER